MSLSSASTVRTAYHSRVEFVDDKTAIYRVVDVVPNVRPESEKWFRRMIQCCMVVMGTGLLVNCMNFSPVWGRLLLAFQATVLCLEIYSIWKCVPSFRWGCRWGNCRGYDIIYGPPIKVVLPSVPGSPASQTALSDTSICLDENQTFSDVEK